MKLEIFVVVTNYTFYFFKVDGEVVGCINNGLCVLLGIARTDTAKDAEYMLVVDHTFYRISLSVSSISIVKLLNKYHCYIFVIKVTSVTHVTSQARGTTALNQRNFACV